MNKSGFFPKLAGQSIRKNGRLYTPYFLTCVGASAMFYIMVFLMQNDGLNDFRRGAAYVSTVLSLGAVVIAIFSAILLFYTNSFLMKRRKTELGLYNILGMEKRHIGRILFWETVYTAVLGIGGGILAGILFSKLVLLLLCALLKFDVLFGFYVSWLGIALTAAVYCAIFFLNLLANLARVGKSKPIDLLRSASTGEREPKTRWLLAVLGFLSLGAGYAIAIAVKAPLKALSLFFVAVILVIIGTYCLFTAGSIAILKLLRKNRAYYYRARHFTTVSGMLHRMKRNAAGLASICILSTMVLVTVSSTLCLYLGAEDFLDTRYPHDVAINYSEPGEGVVEKSVSVIQAEAEKQGIEIKNLSIFKSLELSLRIEGHKLIRDEAAVNYSYDDPNAAVAYFITDAEYSELTGNEVSLQSGETLICTKNSDWAPPEALNIMGKDFNARVIGDFPVTGQVAAYVSQTFCFVVSEGDLYTLNDLSKALVNNHYNALSVSIGLDLDADNEAQSAFFDGLYSELAETVTGEFVDENGVTQTYTYYVLYGECRADDAAGFYSTYGGFFFLGIFLGFLFLMAAVLIIYYKQVSEGYEDAGRFHIMRQVGMSDREVRQSIKNQIVTVFALPLLMAAVHIAAAFQMLTRLLTIFSLYNVGLFAFCCLGSLLAFAAIYAAVYALTARAYYQIVKT